MEELFSNMYHRWLDHKTKQEDREVAMLRSPSTKVFVDDLYQSTGVKSQLKHLQSVPRHNQDETVQELLQEQKKREQLQDKFKTKKLHFINLKRGKSPARQYESPRATRNQYEQASPTNNNNLTKKSNGDGITPYFTTIPYETDV